MSSRIEIVLTMKTKSVFISSVGSWLGDFLRSWFWLLVAFVNLWIYCRVSDDTTDCLHEKRTNSITTITEIWWRQTRGAWIWFARTMTTAKTTSDHGPINWSFRVPYKTISCHTLKLCNVVLFFCLLFLEKMGIECFFCWNKFWVINFVFNFFVR